jgi:DNA-binding LacI/PurR family transcriptional regulator
MKKLKRRAQPVAGYREILGVLQSEILSGQTGPGARLLTRRKLQDRFRTTPVTINRALRQLAEHGFIEARGRRGTFVVSHPPHISQFAIAFPWEVSHVPSLFYRAIQNEAAKFQSPERQITMFHGISGGEPTPAHKELIELVRARRLAGMVFVHNPALLGQSPLVTEPGLPRVAIIEATEKVRIPTVYPDVAGFFPKACAHLAARGKRKPLVLILGHLPNTPTELARHIQQAAQQGLSIRPGWIQGIALEGRSWAAQIVRAIFEVNPADRPDSLIITDDNLVEDATAGLAAAGQTVEVVALANFPCQPPTAVPVTWLGFDIGRLVSLCLDRLGQQRQGKKFPAHTVIPVIVAEELG